VDIEAAEHVAMLTAAQAVHLGAQLIVDGDARWGQALLQAGFCAAACGPGVEVAM
jgi:hypothetical protein